MPRRSSKRLPQSDYKPVTFQHSEFQRCLPIVEIRNTYAVVSAPPRTILGKISAILAACDLPDILDSSATALQRHALNGNPTLVLRSGNSQVFHVGVKESCDVRESVLCVSIRLLQREMDVRGEVSSRRSISTAACTWISITFAGKSEAHRSHLSQHFYHHGGHHPLPIL